MVGGVAKYLPLVLLLVIAALFLGLRFGWYVPLNYSVSSQDTDAFILASQRSVLSWDFFTSDRPATIALTYKLLEPASGYQITAAASPAEDLHPLPTIQPGLERVAALQGVLSICAWLLLAWIIVRRLSNPGFQIIAVILILGFGFSPPATEWNSVLLSEPISLAFFVILFSLSIELVARLSNEAPVLSLVTKVLMGFWGLVLILWVFSRDTNAYLLPVFCAALSVLLIFRRPLKLAASFSIHALLVTFVLLGALFVFHNVTSQHSGRWINPFFNNMLDYVFPYPDRLAFFENKGMPVTEEVLALRNSRGNEDGFFAIPELMDWTQTRGASTYVQFLLNFPGATFQRFLDDMELMFSENRQPFFLPNEEKTTPELSYIGDLLHPKSPSVIWVVLLELAVFGFLAIRADRRQNTFLFALFLVFFLGELLMLFVSIHGDARGVIRHGIGSLIPMRLSVWLLPPLILNIYGLEAISKQKPRKAKA
jgi:hypothetical protein